MNVWNGYITLDRDGPRIALGEDEVLLGKSYYFHVPSSTENPYLSVLRALEISS